MPRVVNVKHARRGSYAYIGRPGSLGNPFVMHRESDRARVIDEFREWFYIKVEHDPEFREMVLALKGQDLGCWCAPRACHGDVILEWLEAQP